MKRLAAWLTPFLVSISYLLHRGDIVSGRQALALIVAVEMLLAVRLLRRLRTIRTGYRISRRHGHGPIRAIQDGVSALGSGPAVALFAGELLVWASLWRFISGGWRNGEGEFSYHRRSPLIGIVFVTVITAPAELLLIELLVPWHAPRLVLLFLGAYSLLWILGYAASQITAPHRVDDDGVIIRKGFLAEVRLPFAQIATIDIATGAVPPKAEGWGAAVLTGIGYVAVAGRADVQLVLREPVTIRQLRGESAPVRELRIAVDQPVQFIAAISGKLSLPQAA